VETVPVADCHNHTGDDPDNEEFSSADKDSNDENREWGYLLTLSGRVKKYVPKLIPGAVPSVDRRQGDVSGL
jgi:hypothetical protein